MRTPDDILNLYFDMLRATQLARLKHKALNTECTHLLLVERQSVVNALRWVLDDKERRENLDHV